MRYRHRIPALNKSPNEAREKLKLGSLLGLCVLMSSTAHAIQPEFQLPFKPGTEWEVSPSTAPQAINGMDRPDDSADLPQKAIEWSIIPVDAVPATALDVIWQSARPEDDAQAPRASASGTVKHIEHTADKAAVTVQIDHGQGWFSSYSGLASASVKLGDPVQTGQRLGTSRTSPQGKALFRFEISFDINDDGIADLSPASIERQIPVFQDKPYQALQNLNSAQALAAPRRYWVDITRDTYGYASATCMDTSLPDNRICRPVGPLYGGRNYVYCKKRGVRYADNNGNYNTWWLWTDLDNGNKGYVSAYYLRRWGNDEAKDNNGRTIPNC